MCLPVAAIPVALAVAQAGLTYAQQAASVRAANRSAAENARAAKESANNQYRSLLIQQIQQEDAATEEIARVERDAMVAESTASLAGLEAGAGGRSVAEVSREFRASALRYRTATERNLAYARGGTALNLQAIGLQAEGRVRGFRPNYQRPSLIGAGLTIAKGGFDSFNYQAPSS